MNQKKQEWLELFAKDYPGCNENILSFIYDIAVYYHNNDEIKEDAGHEAITNLFSSGYCYYFAKMLEDNFEGKPMWLYKRSHIVFMTPDEICYDIWGVFDDYGYNELYPIEALTKTPLDGFRHIGNDVKALYTGDCTDTITWVLYDNGILSICGKGELPNYSNGKEPWHEYNHLVKNIEIAETISNSTGRWSMNIF